ncbi:hypothetical protein FJD34_21395 [Pseudomonas brenneri]|uniref:Uncharacterized protein n=1 Tax=Pseudomonas brenneri TaxID=129817 RepID=A0A5B2UNH7_9PSED|nr:hypothetical protein [Pseudomonas brenneri]KAA2228563.1 hypothetical protein F1720_18270 [Pseudomonas brenneri]TWR76071.1 hypothetical protein FJD34_21395 [Pseudomonas brenneri]
MPAKIVNDYAGCLAPRGVLGFFAGKPAPTKSSHLGTFLPFLACPFFTSVCQTASVITLG